MVGRVLLLIAAFVVAGLGALLVFLYAEQSDERALADLEPTPVLVVANDVAAGTSVAAAQEAGAFVLVDRPASAVPLGALDNLDEQGENVVLTDLLAGEVLLEQRLGNPADLERLPIPDGQIAASFTFEDRNRVADFISPGSQVAVFLTRQSTGDQEVDPETGQQVTSSEQTQLLLPEVTVIAVGSTTTVTETVTSPEGQQQTTEVNRALLTLALDQSQTEKLILAQTVGELYLGLLTDTSVIQPDGPTSADNLFEGGAS